MILGVGHSAVNSSCHNVKTEITQLALWRLIEMDVYLRVALAVQVFVYEKGNSDIFLRFTKPEFQVALD